ncbi:hypothetical protein F2Q70_00018209 [Brassica cretica]|uniref:DBC1/CARP1 catalytically inactive NUDIX hydrolase domain-containing protein n=1 Tax=Brassica cretica TaxID=69181 RepID=A0A8S9HYS6_BRACR|nr:hypothetical protein F2Q70_00018209 [Brassica cretica]
MKKMVSYVGYSTSSFLLWPNVIAKLLITSCHLVIHYDRVGTDGVSSFREITVLFVPDLSECIPSFDAWKTRWVAHKKALAERDRLLSQEIKKDVIVGKGSNDAGEVAKDAEKKTSGDPSSAQASGTKKTVKKIIKRVVKTPVNDEKGVARPGENEEKGSEIIVGAQTGGSSDPGAKANEQTPSKTRIVKKVAKKKVAEVDKCMDSVTRRSMEMMMRKSHVNCFQWKRHQEELSAKQKEAETQNKRQKTVEHNDKETPAITESVPEKGDKESSATETVANTEDPVGKEKTTGDEAAATMEVDSQDDEIDEGDPEEDPEEETVEVPQKKDEHNEKTSDTVSDAVTEVATDREEEKGSIVEKTDSKSAETKPKSESDKNEKQEEGTSGATKREETVDKELLQVKNPQQNWRN